jgi:hypothetical protein
VVVHTRTRKKPPTQPLTCDLCGTALPRKAGRPRKYCSTCRPPSLKRGGEGGDRTARKSATPPPLLAANTAPCLESSDTDEDEDALFRAFWIEVIDADDDEF